MNFGQWSKARTVLIRMRRDLRDYIKKVAKTRGVTMYFLINEMVFEKYFKHKK
jgi:hypothetical protein